jgi:predicted nucleotidyltransferase
VKHVKERIRQNRYLRITLVLSNWLFQGILRADRTEKLYRILFTLILSAGFFLVFRFVYNSGMLWSVLFGFLTGHTVNWILNGNFHAILIHRMLLSKVSGKNLFLYLHGLKERLNGKGFILYSASFGSICRGDLKESSDLDLSIVRKPGFKNSLNALWFILKEKKIADGKGIPLELFLSDTPENSIRRFKEESNPVVLYDPDKTLEQYYRETLTIEEAMKLNGVD